MLGISIETLGISLEIFIRLEIFDLSPRIRCNTHKTRGKKCLFVPTIYVLSKNHFPKVRDRQDKDFVLVFLGAFPTTGRRGEALPLGYYDILSAKPLKYLYGGCHQ